MEGVRRVGREERDAGREGGKGQERDREGGRLERKGTC